MEPHPIYALFRKQPPVGRGTTQSAGDILPATLMPYPGRLVSGWIRHRYGVPASGVKPLHCGSAHSDAISGLADESISRDSGPKSLFSPHLVTRSEPSYGFVGRQTLHPGQGDQCGYPESRNSLGAWPGRGMIEPTGTACGLTGPLKSLI